MHKLLFRRARIEIRVGFRGRKGVAHLLGLVLLQAPDILVSQSVSRCPDGPNALVLSGGGAKGLAHVGVIAVLDSLGARPDLVVGTSMGAIIGALYAGGMSGRRIDSLVRALPIEALFRAEERRVPRGWRPLTPMAVWGQGERGFELQSPAIREAETGALLNAVLLSANLRARGDFDSLPTRFRAVATDLATREPVVLAQGDLARAVRASAAVPLVLPPEQIEGRLLSDGGLSANLPVRIARELGARWVIVSDVTSDPLPTEMLTSPLAVADQLAGFLFHQPEDSLGADDLGIRHPVREFSSLDFSPDALDRLLALGHRTADSILSGAECLPRATPREGPFPRTVGRISAVNLRAGERNTLSEMLGLEEGEPLDVPLLRDRLRRLGDADAFREVWLGPQGGEPVDFRIEVVRAPRRMLALDLAYDNELGGRMGAGAVDHALFGTVTDATALLTLGRYEKELRLGLRRYFGLLHSRVAPTIEVQLRDLGIRRFDSTGIELPEAEAREAAIFAGLERDFGNRWVVELGLDARAWNADDGDRSAAGVALRMERESRSGPRVGLSGVWTGTYRRLHAQVGGAWPLGPVRLAPEAHLGWGEELPLHARFPLGGYEGFPGLHLEERRGDRESMASLDVEWPIEGPLALRLRVAAGRVADGGSVLDGDGWLGGARAGLGAETPLGPVRVEYGVATNGRRAVLVRLGSWF